MDIDLLFENAPGLGNSCPGLVGLKITLTGTLIGGQWTGNGFPRRIDFDDSAGLVSHSVVGNGNPIAVRGQITDTQNTLTVS